MGLYNDPAVYEKWKAGFYTPTAQDYSDYIVKELNEYGYTLAQIDVRSDGGSDIFIDVLPSYQLLLQARYSDYPVNAPVIQNLSKRAVEAHVAVACIVTNNTFTGSSLDMAKKHHVNLIANLDLDMETSLILRSLRLVPDRILDRYSEIEHLREDNAKLNKKLDQWREACTKWQEKAKQYEQQLKGIKREHKQELLNLEMRSKGSIVHHHS